MGSAAETPLGAFMHSSDEERSMSSLYRVGLGNGHQPGVLLTVGSRARPSVGGRQDGPESPTRRVVPTNLPDPGFGPTGSKSDGRRPGEEGRTQAQGAV